MKVSEEQILLLLDVLHDSIRSTTSIREIFVLNYEDRLKLYNDILQQQAANNYNAAADQKMYHDNQIRQQLYGNDY